jgi:dihydroneopterin aldolase
MLNGETGITPAEQEILAKVWFEVKFFSNLKQHQNGLVINSTEDYDQALEELNNSELSILQLKYQTVENL